MEGVPGAGRHRRHHALQLPGHGAAVDVAHGRGVWQHLCAQAFGARSLLHAVHRPAGAGSGPAARRAERRQRRQAGRGHSAAGPAREGREPCGNHAVLMPDADVDNAVSALMGAAYGSCGERCMAIPLLVAVGDTVGDAVIAGLKTEIAKMKVGPGTDNSNDMGPLVTKPHFEKVKGYVDQGVAEGATLVVDGRGVKVAGHEEGYFMGACLFDNVKPGMKIYQEEIFGPVLGVVRVKTLQEAMQLINDHEYGNGTCIFTRDGEAARYFTDHIQVGMVGVNVPLPVPVAYHSFGGWKRSLFGDLHAYGPDAVRFYTKRKTITQRWPSAGVREGAVFSFPSSR